MPKKARDDFLPELPPSPEPAAAVKMDVVDESAVFENKPKKTVSVAEPPEADAATEKKKKLKEHPCTLQREKLGRSKRKKLR